MSRQFALGQRPGGYLVNFKKDGLRMASMELTGPNSQHFAVLGQKDEFDIGGFLKRRKFLIIFLVLLGAGGAWLLFERQIPIYRSTALVQVIYKNMADSNATALDRNLKDASLVITSPGLLASAIERHELSKLTLLKGLNVEDASDPITKMTAVTTEFEDTTIVEVAVAGTLADEVSVIANALRLRAAKLS